MHSIIKRVMSYLFFAFVYALVLNISISSEVNALTNEKSDKIKNIVSSIKISSEQQEILALKTPADLNRTMPVFENGSQDFHTMGLGGNLIENGDFELDPNYYGTWEAYNSADIEAAFIWDDQTYHGDSGKSISIQGNGLSSYLINGIAIAPGKAYSFEAWARAVDIVTSEDEFGVCVCVEQYNAEGNLIDGTDYYFFQEGTFDWQPADLKFVSNPKAESLIITLFLNGSGTVWFDDVSLFDEGDIPTPLLKVVADPGMNKSTYKGFDVALDGSKSINSYATPLSYSWAFASKPDGSFCVLVDSDTVSPSFRPDIAGDYIISLTVDNGLGDNDTKQVIIRAKEFNDMQDDINYNLMNNMEQNYITGYTIADMIPLSDGWIIIGDSNSRQINIINALTGEAGRSYQLSTTPSALDFDFDFDSGIIVATQAANNKIIKIDLNKDELSYIETSVDYNNLIFGENGVVFAYSPQWPNGKVGIIDIQNDSEIGVYSINESYIGFMVYDKNKNNLLLGVEGISPSSLYRYTYDETSKCLTSAQSVDSGSNGQDLSISDDGNHLAFCCGSGNGYPYYTIYDLDSSNITCKFGEWNTGAYPYSADFSHDNNYIVTYNYSDIQLFNISTHEFIRSIGTRVNTNYCSVRISRGDKIVFSEGIDCLYFYRMDGTPIGADTISIDSISTDITSPQDAGNKINITANVSGGADNNYYHFWVYDGNMWTLLQSYTTENTFEWTPQTEGMYYLVVGVKDKNSSNVYDAYNTIPYIVTKPAPVPTLIEIAGPNSITIPYSDSIAFQYMADVNDQFGNVMTDELVEWSLDGATAGVSVDSSTGVVTIQSTAQAGTFTVRATDGTITNTYLVTLIKPLYSTISPIAVCFDKKISAQADITVTMTLNGGTLTEIKNGSNTLVNGTDYMVSGNSVVIKKGYLAALPAGNYVMKFNFSSGCIADLNITISNSTIVSFADTNLEAVIRTNINKSEGEILASDVEVITSLDARNKNIVNIAGIDSLIYLTDLRIGENQISNINPISGLNNLSILELCHNQISDVSSLKDLSNLTYLGLFSNNIKDISILSNLVNLVDLDVRSNDLSNINVVEEFTCLEWLLASGNSISDISPLRNLLKLEVLDLDVNKIKDVSWLQSLGNLYNLNLSYNEISNISQLSGLTSLESLNLSYNNLTNISSLANLINLNDLRLNNNQITDISPLNNLKKLEGLFLNDNQISDIEVIKNLINLNNLYLNTNPIKDFSPAKLIYSQLVNKDFTLNIVGSIDILGQNIVKIPISECVKCSYKADVKDIDNVKLSCETVTWSLVNPVQGVQIDGNTGVITINYTASPGTVIIKTVNGSISNTFTVALYIANSTIAPVSASFDKKTSAQADISVTMTLNGNTLSSIKNGVSTLVSGTDYTVSGSTVMIKKSYLSGLANGNAILTFYFSAGNTAELNITITDSTPAGGGTPTGGGTPSGGGVPFIPFFPIGGFSGNLNSGNEPDNGVMTIAPTCSDTNAKVEITADNYKALLDSAAEENGIKNLIINVNDVSLDEYNAQLPSSALTGATNEANITLNTAVANITLPSNMFSGTDIQGAQSIGINVAAVERSTLPESVAKIIGKAPVVDISVTVNGDVKPWNNPDAPVTVSIPYTLKDGENPDNITVFYIDGAGNLVNMQGIYDPETKLVSFTTTHFSKYLVKENKVTFNDLTGFEGYAGYIESMAAKGIINGIGNNKFAPGKVLTRAEFSKLLVEMLQLDITDRSAIFSDIDANIWYAPYVNAAYKAGLIKGVGNNRFDPDNTITAQDAALILVRALKYKGITITARSLSGIKDDKDISNYAREAVGFNVSNGIMRLDSEGNFNAGDTVNRASAAEYIYKVFNFKGV